MTLNKRFQETKLLLKYCISHRGRAGWWFDPRLLQSTCRMSLDNITNPKLHPSEYECVSLVDRKDLSAVLESFQVNGPKYKPVASWVKVPGSVLAPSMTSSCCWTSLLPCCCRGRSLRGVRQRCVLCRCWAQPGSASACVSGSVAAPERRLVRPRHR